MAVLGGSAELVVRSSIVEPGDPTATAENIRSSATLFRLGFVADLVQATFFLFTAMALYLLLRHVNELVARAMVVLVAISVAIISLEPAQPVHGTVDRDGSRLHEPGGSDRLTMLFVDMHHNGYLIAQMFFGLWLVPLGYLVVRSGFFPRCSASCSRSEGSRTSRTFFVQFLAPGVAETISPYVLDPRLLRGLFVGYLLVKGVRDPRTARRDRRWTRRCPRGRRRGHVRFVLLAVASARRVRSTFLTSVLGRGRSYSNRIVPLPVTRSRARPGGLRPLASSSGTSCSGP